MKRLEKAMGIQNTRRPYIGKIYGNNGSHNPMNVSNEYRDPTEFKM